MRTVYIAEDGQVFGTRKECAAHEKQFSRRVTVPVMLLEEAIRQCTPYMVSAKERRDLAGKLTAYLPK